MKMALQAIMRCEGIKHDQRFSSIHRRHGSLDGDQPAGYRHVVAVHSPIQELPAKMEESIRPNHNSDCKEEQLQLMKSVWDCESSLYDSFELYTFSRQLNHAIAAASMPSSLISNHQLIGGIRSLSMPHYSSIKSTPTTTQCQYFPLHVDTEEMNLKEEKLRSNGVEGNTDHQISIHDRHQTVARSELERQQDAQVLILKTHNKRMGFPRSVQRLFTRLFHKKAGSCKVK